jgi:HAD superfamily hydrolase (TIGR01509 family)
VSDDTNWLVIFDCDGVLVDSERIGLRVDQRILREYGITLSDEQIVERFVGRSRDYFISQIELEIGEKITLDWQAVYGPWYSDAFERELEPVAGIEAVLQALPYRSCVASSGPMYKITHSLGTTDLAKYFGDRVFSADAVQHGKPAPDLFLHAARQMGALPERCVVVEDSRFGVQAAKAAGMRVIAFGGGITPSSWLEAEEVPLIFDMSQLTDALDCVVSERVGSE